MLILGNILRSQLLKEVTIIWYLSHHLLFFWTPKLIFSYWRFIPSLKPSTIEGLPELKDRKMVGLRVYTISSFISWAAYSLNRFLAVPIRIWGDFVGYTFNPKPDLILFCSLCHPPLPNWHTGRDQGPCTRNQTALQALCKPLVFCSLSGRIIADWTLGLRSYMRTWSSRSPLPGCFHCFMFQ